jgi:hypothetical protein
MQLTETPEGKSSLQMQLEEAEKRAQKAEVSVQNAQATLARTLLEASRVEAVVTARIKAQSEAEIEALRAELDVLKRVAPAGDSSPDDEDAVPATAAAESAVCKAEPTPESRSYRSITLKEWDLPFKDEEAADAAPGAEVIQAPLWGIPTPFRAALLAVVAVVAVVSYTLTASFISKPGAAPVAGSIAGMASGLALADGRSESVVAGDWTAARVSSGNWLLYMPVERSSLVQYLAGRAWSKIQLAEKR